MNKDIHKIISDRALKYRNDFTPHRILDPHLEDAFNAGAMFILNSPELMREQMEEFHDWIENSRWNHDHRAQKTHTTSELFDLYIEYLNNTSGLNGQRT